MIDVELKENERLDDLQCAGLYIIQNVNAFCFGVDAVLLSGFANIKRNDRVLDLCCGNGIIPLLLYGKNKGMHITGVELQPESAELAHRSVNMNRAEDKIKIICGNIKQIDKLTKGGYDAVTCNPPYMAAGIGFKNDYSAKTIARHEIECTIKDVFEAADKMLKYGGRLYMVHRAERMCDIMATAREKRLEPKEMQLVQYRIGKAPVLMLISFVKGGKPPLKVLEPLILYDENGEYTSQTRKIYGE